MHVFNVPSKLLYVNLSPVITNPVSLHPLHPEFTEYKMEEGNLAKPDGASNAHKWLFQMISLLNIYKKMSLLLKCRFSKMCCPLHGTARNTKTTKNFADSFRTLTSPRAGISVHVPKCLAVLVPANHT